MGWLQVRRRVSIYRSVRRLAQAPRIRRTASHRPTNIYVIQSALIPRSEVPPIAWRLLGLYAVGGVFIAVGTADGQTASLL